MAEPRYTLSLPTEIYTELREQAEKHDVSVREVVRQCLKFGLVAMKLDEDPNADLYIREKLPQKDGDSPEIRETRLKFLW